MKLLTTEWVTLPKTPEGEKYKIRGLTGPEAQPLVNLFREAEIECRRTGKEYDPENVTMPPDLAKQIITDGVVDWAGVDDEDGEPLPFRRDLAQYLPYSRMDRLLALIINKTDMGLDREKNLQSPSKSKRKRRNSTA